MTYVGWAALYEGTSDAAYFEVLLPRVMNDLALTRGTRHSTIPDSPAILLTRADVDTVAEEACNAVDAFHLVFIHADTGGRAQAEGIAARSIAYCEAMNARCGWPPARCITIEPCHETEAWLLCDPDAVTGALGFRGNAADVGLPANANAAERIADPKAVLKEAVVTIRGRRRSESTSALYPAIAQRQSLAALRASRSFRAFEDRLVAAMRDLGCLQ